MVVGNGEAKFHCLFGCWILPYLARCLSRVVRREIVIKYMSPRRDHRDTPQNIDYTSREISNAYITVVD